MGIAERLAADIHFKGNVTCIDVSYPKGAPVRVTVDAVFDNREAADRFVKFVDAVVSWYPPAEHACLPQN